MSSGTGKGLPAPGSGLAQLRLRGTRGGLIAKHRSMIGLRWTPRRALRALVLALAGFAGVAAGLPALGRAWAWLDTRLLALAGLPSDLGWHVIEVGSLLRIAVPYPLLEGAWPAMPHWIAVGGGTAALLALSFIIPARFLPARYFLRFIAGVQAVSLGYFAFASPPFPYPLPGYIAGFLTAGMAVLSLVPIALGFGFYIFDHSLPRQVLLTVLIVGHLAILLPLQGLAHAWLTHRLSLLVQPPLFFVFGLLVEVLVFVSFYGWAMSWPGTEIPQSGGGPGSRP